MNLVQIRYLICHCNDNDLFLNILLNTVAIFSIEREIAKKSNFSEVTDRLATHALNKHALVGNMFLLVIFYFLPIKAPSGFVPLYREGGPGNTLYNC